MRGLLIFGVLAATMMLTPAYSQSVADEASFRNMTVGGIHLYGVSVFGGYSTSAYPAGLGQIQTGASQLGPDTNYGASASVGWQYHRLRSDFSLLYSGTYGGMVRYSDANAFSQSLSFSLTRKLSPRWTFSLSGTGADTTMVQFLYQPSSLSLISQVPATMDDLAAAFSLGQFSSNQIASTLTGAPVLESPARSLLLGDRVLSYSGQASLTYAHSSRLSFHLASFTAGGQHRFSDHSEPNYVLPRSIGVEGGMGMSYMLSPRTQVGLDLTANRISSRYQSGYVSNAFATVGRKMGVHWFLMAHAGGSMNKVINQAYGTPRTTNVIGGGSIGFRTYRHTLVGSYDRSSADTYGLAIGTITALTAAWNWHAPGSRWSVFTSYSQQAVRNTGFQSISGWEATGGVTQILSAHLRLTGQYVYLSNSGQYLGNLTDLAIHSVRLSMSWTPQPAGH